MALFWRKTVKELATQLDVIDELIHALVVALEHLEQEQREALPPGLPHCPEAPRSRPRDL